MEAEKSMALTTGKNGYIMETVPFIFNRIVAENGPRIALRTKELGLWHNITWNQYHKKAEQVGCALVSLGLERWDAA